MWVFGLISSGDGLSDIFISVILEIVYCHLMHPNINHDSPALYLTSSAESTSADKTSENFSLTASSISATLMVKLEETPKEESQAFGTFLLCPTLSLEPEVG